MLICSSNCVVAPACSEKGPEELLQLLSDVLAKITPKHQRQGGAHEAAEQTAERLAGLLRIVKYQPNMDLAMFRQLLASGDRDVAQQVLKWVLAQGQALEKRAFVGYYLSFPDMPEELCYHPEVMELREAIKGLQADFVDTHKALDAAQQEVKDLPQLRSRIKQMQEEKERLADKVDKAAAQASGLPDAATYRDVCVALRQEHDKEVAGSQQLQAQQQQLERAEGAFQRSAGRLREMQQHLAGQGGGEAGDAADGAGVLEVLQDDVARLRVQVTSRWPAELEAKQRRLAAVQDSLNNGISTEADLQRLLSQEVGLRQQIGAMQERQAAAERARAADRAFLQVRQAQQMAGLVSRKKAELTAKLRRLQERRDALAAQLDSSSADVAGGGAAAAGVSESDWVSKYEAIKAKLPSYKGMKRELGELEAEVFVLNRTQEILQQQEDTLQRAVQQLEQRAGVQGYADLAAGLEKVSEAKGDVDEAKGQVLQEVSTTVQQITAAIKQKKVQLAPAIQELRGLRQQQQEVDALHAEKKAAYESAVGPLEAAVSGLSTDVAGLQQQLDADSAALAKVKGRLGQLDGSLARLAATGGEELKRRCQLQLSESEALLRQLREQQRSAKERHAYSLTQTDMMSDLIGLLQLKQQLQASCAQGGQLPGAGSTGGRQLGSAGGVVAGGGGGRGLGGQSYNTNVMVL
ncbi:hypothetical protein COO60DRAFT_1654950 [Scenedesmus sp. NREL 46B-D3]|nr:hypothetical protein COO60DRAFT_1654950 [Scenedesmus sp. NREL 46B-D3]